MFCITNTELVDGIWTNDGEFIDANISFQASMNKNALPDFLENDMADYRKTYDISRTLVGNKIVDNSDVVGASPVGAAPTTSSFST